MLKMVEKQYIKHLYEEEGKSLNEITRMTGHNYRTVAKYANQEDWNEKEREVKAESYPVLKDYIAVIDGWLEEEYMSGFGMRRGIRAPTPA